MSKPRTTSLRQSDIDFDEQCKIYNASTDKKCIRVRDESKRFEVIVNRKYVGSSAKFEEAQRIRDEAINDKELTGE
jgi:glutaredoxin-related protein